LERLRTQLTSRGVTTTAVALSTVLAANAVPLAPVGLAATLSTAALAGTTLAATATATAVKTIAMTTLQKTLIAATLAVAVGTGVYEARQASKLRTEVQAFKQMQVPLANQNEHLTRERDEATRQLAALRDDNERLNRNTAELLKLRGEVARLRSDSRELREIKTSADQKQNDPIKPEVEFILARMSQLRRGLEQTPSKKIPEIQLLSDDNWLHIGQHTRSINLDTDSGINEGLSYVRQLAKQFAADVIQHALGNYTKANGGQLPTDVSQLKPYFAYQVDDSILEKYKTTKNQTEDAILQRYQMTKTGNVSDLHPQETVMGEKAAVDAQIDTLYQIGLNFTSWEGTGANKGHTGTISSASR
ncbi:MAG: hypothetical protein KBH45_19830, partial [Verrucomicrobia bacterium]|nr:hypothetical protein [Verrucomicrobiota bacterium]